MKIWWYYLLCLFFPTTILAQKGHSYLDQTLPNTWQAIDSHFQQTLPVDDQWWTNFNDPILDTLIEVAIRQNNSIQMAIERIAIAKANLRIQQGNFYPTLNATTGWNRQQTSGSINSQPQNISAYYNATLSMSWEIDLFGRIRNRVKAEKKNFAASQEEYNAVMISLCAQVATAYIHLRELQQEIEIVKKNCESQQAIVIITEKRFDTGLVSKLDVSQAQSVYYETKATLPMLEYEIIQYANSIGVLLGFYPEKIRPIIDKTYPLPNYTEIVGIGIPTQLLLRRPDLRASLYQVDAQAATLGASKSDWWPTVFINGSIGFASHKLDQFIHQNSLTYEIAPTISWKLFQGTQLIQATRQAKAQLDESIGQFNQDVLTAVQEVDNAMNAYKYSIKQIVSLREVVNQSKQTLDLSLDLYKQGLTPFQNVLDAQRSLFTYEQDLVQAEGSSLLYLIQLYQALGGGWNNQYNQ